MGDPIINTQVDAINATLGNIKVDLAALRPSIRAIKDAIAETYLTDTIENVPIASFSDGADEIPVRELQVAIEPVQNLNGQTSPYPAGGSKNLFKATPYSGTYDGAVGADLKEGTGMLYSVMSDGKVQIDVTTAWKYRCFATDALAAGTYTVRGYSDKASIRSTIYQTDGNLIVKAVKYNQKAAGWGTVQTFAVDEGDRIAICIGANAVATLITEFQAEVGSTATNPVPFENICPISGHTEVNVVRTGKNLFGGNLLRDGVLASMASATDHPDDRYVSFSSNATVTQRITVTSGIEGKFKENTQYTFIMTVNKTTGTGANLRINYTDGTYTPIFGAVVGSKTMTLTVSAANKTVASLSKQNSAGTTDLYYDESGIFEGVLTTADFKPYLGTTAALTFGQTVYGGTLNPITGVMAIDRAMVDLGTLTWVYQTQGYMTTSSAISDIKAPSQSSALANIICSALAADTAYNIYNGSNGIGIHSSGQVRVRYDNMPTDAAAFKTAMSGVQLVYELATPTTVQLTAAEIETLFGQNNIWSDSGNVVKLTYRKAWEIALAEGE